MPRDLAGPSADDKCATCGHIALYHWVRIVAPMSGECEVGPCACRGFRREAERDASSNTPPDRAHSDSEPIDGPLPFYPADYWPEATR